MDWAVLCLASVFQTRKTAVLAVILFREHKASFGCNSGFVLAEMKIVRVDWNARLKKQLRSYPMIAFEMSPFSDSIKGVRQKLVMLVDDPDPELKRLACSILRQNYPNPLEACR